MNKYVVGPLTGKISAIQWMATDWFIKWHWHNSVKQSTEVHAQTKPKQITR